MNDLRELFEGFTIHLQAAGRRPSTVDWYAKHARRFFAWLDQETIPASVGEMSALRIRKFIAYQQGSVRAWDSNPHVPTQERGLSSSYIVGGVRTLRAWFNWMHDEGFLQDNPMDKVRTPKQQQRIIAKASPADHLRLQQCS
jgi:site-specific recombinase XerD